MRLPYWDLFDLYGTLMGGLDKVFAEPHWRKDILPAMNSLPGNLASLFIQYATDLRCERDPLSGAVPGADLAAVVGSRRQA